MTRGKLTMLDIHKKDKTQINDPSFHLKKLKIKLNSKKVKKKIIKNRKQTIIEKITLKGNEHKAQLSPMNLPT